MTRDAGVADHGIEVRDLVVQLGDAEVLHGVDIDVAPGDWLTVVGPNGAGKTTLLKAVAGLVPFVGSIRLGGADLGGLSSRHRSRLVAVVPQTPILPPSMTVTDYVLLGRTPHIPLFGIERPEDLEITEATLHRLELSDFATRTLDTLSGGERQRAVLARALVQMAPILLLDEPTTALDVGHQQEVLDLVDDLRRVRQLTVLSTMHDLTLAGQYGDRVALLDRGRLAASGTAEDVLTEEHLSYHYGARVTVLRHEGGIVVVPLRGEGDAARQEVTP